MAADVESARRDWENAYRRLAEVEKDPPAAAGVPLQLRVLTEELRRRVGSTFMLHELAAEYGRADDWARDVLADRAPFSGWLSSFSVVQGAAFHRYSRGASDYEP